MKSAESAGARSGPDAENRAELLARFRGPVEDYDAERVEFWRSQSDAEHAKAMVELARFAAMVVSHTGYDKDPRSMFPGFPGHRWVAAGRFRVTEGDEPPRCPERPPDPSWAQKVLALNDHLATANLPYAFGGAIALNYHREPRSTLDVGINVFVSPEHGDVVLTVLAGVYQVQNRERAEQHLSRYGQTRTRWNTTYIDLFLANTEFHAAMAGRIERKPFDGGEIPVLSIEDLIVCKVLFDRLKDWLDIQAVVAAEGGRLDRGYVAGWLTYFLGSEDGRVGRFCDVVG